MAQMNSPAFAAIQPAEWENHDACWLAWPSDGSLWQEELKSAQSEFTALCRAIADLDPKDGQRKGEQLEILVPDQRNLALAQAALQGTSARFHLIPFGDIWLRDTGPIFTKSTDGSLTASRFRFNGWGEKYILPHDAEVSSAIAQASGLPTSSHPWILEGGSVEVDGQGTCLTTRQCLLNPNRNPGITEKDWSPLLEEALGVTQVIWLDEGLLNDHTDGHIDTLARFAAPGVVLCMEATTEDDPNRKVMEQIADTLSAARDASGKPLQVIRVPSPGKVQNSEGFILPASYMNFYISNTSVIVPTYGSAFDESAVRKIAECFPGRKTVGLSAKSILAGGGAFHCITQQQPIAGRSGSRYTQNR